MKAGHGTPRPRQPVRLAAVLALIAATCLGGCARYADFTLPPLPGSNERLQLELAPTPVIGRGEAGAWDSHDVLNPAVVRRDGTYFNFYSGFDGRTWHTGLATSTDGARWVKSGKVLSPDAQTWEGSYIAANGSALASGGQFLYWYQAGPRNSPRIGLAISSDGNEWRKHASPVLESGPRGSWDERGVADPYVRMVGDQFYMYYLGQDRARRQRIGIARSRDGIAWEKLRRNPVLELSAETALGEPAVWPTHDCYWMLYTATRQDGSRSLRLARSKDGVAWEKIESRITGRATWNTKVLCDPEVDVSPEGVRIWFGGGNVASPDENLNGQIGAGTLRSPS